MHLFCNGKKDFCNEPDCTKLCEHYDGSGAKYIKTVFEEMRSMDVDAWVRAISKMVNVYFEQGKDINKLFCDGKAGCIDETGTITCDDDRRKECIKRWLNSPMKEM